MRSPFLSIPAMLLYLYYRIATEASVTLPKIIAHRGGSGPLPEYTEPALLYSVQTGSDFLECDVQITSDRELLCFHDPMVRNTTGNIEASAAAMALFGKARTYLTTPCSASCPTVTSTGWFFADYPLEAWETVRVRQRYKERSSEFDDQLGLVKFENFLDLAISSAIGVYVEIKNSAFYVSKLGVEAAELIVEALCRKGFCSLADVNATITPPVPAWLQTFQKDDIIIVRSLIGNQIKVAALTWGPHPAAPRFGFMYMRTWSQTEENTPPTDSTLTTYPVDPLELKRLSVDAIAFAKGQVILDNGLVSAVHALGMEAHVWTFVDEPELTEGGASVMRMSPLFEKDPQKELQYFFNLSVDALFGDWPETLVAQRRRVERQRAVPIEGALPGIAQSD